VAGEALKRYVNAAGLYYARLLSRHEYRRQRLTRVKERSIEYCFLFGALTSSAPVTILDVGPGEGALPSLLRSCGYLVTAIDNMKDFWPRGTVNRHYHVINDDITDTQLGQPFDFICCISALEHIERFDEAVASMFRLLNPGDRLVISFPYNESYFIENVYRHPEAGYGANAPYICRVYSRAELERWEAEHDWRITEQEYWRVFSGRYWTSGELLRPPVRASSEEPHQLTCVMFEKNA